MWTTRVDTHKLSWATRTAYTTSDKIKQSYTVFLWRDRLVYVFCDAVMKEADLYVIDQLFILH